MSEMGRSMYDSLAGVPTSQKGKCKGCGSPLELFELDFRGGSKTMKCTRCGMLHTYRKDIIGKWRLQKAKKPDFQPR